MTLAAWLHTLSPFILQFTDNFGIRWYGMAYLAGFAVAYFILIRLARRGLALIPEDRVGEAMMWLIGGALIGGRIGYVLIYDPSALWSFSKTVPWWELLAINNGGMASHGGMAGVVVAILRISRGWRTETGEIVGRCPPLHMMDLVALVSPFGLFFGRIANFINGELLGRIVTPPGVEGPWWTVQFPQEIVSGHAPELSPQQKNELYTLAAQHVAPGEQLSTRGMLDRLVHHADEHASVLKPLLSSREPSQLFQAAAEGLIVGILVWCVWARPRRPGVVGAFFMIGYGVLRVVTEFSRLPDAQFAAPRPMGLSRGQWLSVALAIVGVSLLIFSLVRKAPRLGGWLSQSVPAGDIKESA